MKLKYLYLFLSLSFFISCKTSKTGTQNNTAQQTLTLSKITNKTPYDPRPAMEQLTRENVIKGSHGEIKLKKPMYFLVFGDSKGSEHLQDVLKRADILKPQFCITTADLVNKGAGKTGENYYKDLDKESGWFFRKYPTWPTLGNHEVSDQGYNINEETYASGVANFADFFGLKDPYYSFTYGNAKFIALDWIKVSESPERLAWLEKELKEAQGKLIFVFKHRPYYTVGSKGYKDVEGKSTLATRLFSKYNVTAVFSGHDHLYYRTRRNNVNYIISSGAGASIYKLKRAGDAIPGDAYYGRTVSDKNKFRFHSSAGKDVFFDEAMYFVLSVKVDKHNTVTFKMIDTKGKVWDKFTFKPKIKP